MKILRLTILCVVLPFVLGGNCQMTGVPAGSSAMSIDSDGDGLSDADEAFLFTLPGIADTDGDGLSDGDEILIYHTNASFPDTDADLLSDFDEIFTHGTDPNLPDTDFDGLSDGLELDPTFGSNPLVADSDGDTILDGDEISLGLDLLIPNAFGVVSDLYCQDFIRVIVGGIEGVYMRSSFSSGFPSGFLFGDVVALTQPSPGDRTGMVRANLRTGQLGFFWLEGDLDFGGGLITGATPTTLSIRVHLSSGFSFEVNFLDLSETADWFVGDSVEIVDLGFGLEMLNTDACEAVLVLP